MHRIPTENSSGAHRTNTSSHNSNSAEKSTLNPERNASQKEIDEFRQSLEKQTLQRLEVADTDRLASDTTVLSDTVFMQSAEGIVNNNHDLVLSESARSESLSSEILSNIRDTSAMAAGNNSVTTATPAHHQSAVEAVARLMLQLERTYVQKSGSTWQFEWLQHGIPVLNMSISFKGNGEFNAVLRHEEPSSFQEEFLDELNQRLLEKNYRVSVSLDEAVKDEH